jgi:hypothetical protein
MSKFFSEFVVTGILLVFLQPSVYYLWQGGSSDSVSDLYSEGAWLESWPEHPAVLTVCF